MKVRIIFFVLAFWSTRLLSQDCFVAIDSLKGQYTGDCKNGKANGTGTAKGIDSYTGSFKNGYPDGVGTYIWANGNSYKGHWKDGLFDDEGTLTKINNNNKDSVVVLNGLWKNGKFINKTEVSTPSKIVALTNGINDFNIKKLGGADGQITIIVKSITGGAQTFSSESPKVDIPVLTNVQLVEGMYFRKFLTNGLMLCLTNIFYGKLLFLFLLFYPLKCRGLRIQVSKVFSN